MQLRKEAEYSRKNTRTQKQKGKQILKIITILTNQCTIKTHPPSAPNTRSPIPDTNQPKAKSKLPTASPFITNLFVILNRFSSAMLNICTMNKVVIQKLSRQELEKKGVFEWPVWEKEVSRFPWTYSETEEFYVIEGEVVLETEEGNFTFKQGDFVTLKEGLVCTWDIKSAIRKYYNFP